MEERVNHYIMVEIALDEPQIFLAFSFKDKEFAEGLAKELQERGIKTWLATREVKPSDNWQLKVKENIQISEYLLAIISKSSIGSYWTQWEFQMAIERERKNKKPCIIPIIIENVKIMPCFNDKQYVDFRYNYKDSLEKIVAMVTAKR